MSNPTVEEVREALDALPDAWPMGSNSPMKRIVAAARLWVDAAEPDIEAAAEVLDPYMVHPLDVMEATKATVNAALGITEDTGG